MLRHTPESPRDAPGDDGHGGNGPADLPLPPRPPKNPDNRDFNHSPNPFVIFTTAPLMYSMAIPPPGTFRRPAPISFFNAPNGSVTSPMPVFTPLATLPKKLPMPSPTSPTNPPSL